MNRSSDRKLWGLVSLLTLASLLVPATAGAWEWPWQHNDPSKNVELRDIVESPRAYLGRRLTFTCRFAMQGKLFKQFNTPFSSRRHTNFSAWIPDAELWMAEERRAVVPTFYVPNEASELIRELQDYDRYELITVTVVIRNDYASLPWMEVEAMAPVADGANVISERMLTHVRNGLDLQSKGQHSNAVEQLEYAVQAGLPPAYRDRVHGALGESYFALKDMEKALGSYGRAILADSEDPELYLRRAEVNLELAHSTAAIDDCESSLALSADYPEVYALMGEAYGQMGKTTKALKLVDMTASTPGLSAEQKAKAEVHRARVYVSAERYTEAVTAYARAMGENSPLAATAWLRKEIGGLYEQRYRATGDAELLDEAIREYGNANVITGNTDAEALFLLAQAKFEKVRAASGTNLQEVVDILKQLNSVDPAYLPAKLLEGRIAMLQKRPEDAARIFRDIVRENPLDADAHRSLAKMYEQSGQLEDAVSVYAKATELDAMDVDAWGKQAELNEKLGRFEAARHAYSVLAGLRPEETLYRYQLGRLCLALDDYQGAVQSSRMAAGQGPQGEAARYNLAIALWAQGNLRDAEMELAALLRENPSHTEAQAARAHLMADLNMDLQAASRLAQDALAADGANPVYQDVMAWVQYRRGEVDAALELLEGLAPAQRSRATWYHLGVIYHNSGRYEEAVEALQKARTPLRQGELKGIAEQYMKRASELLPEAMKDERANRRLAAMAPVTVEEGAPEDLAPVATQAAEEEAVDSEASSFVAETAAVAPEAPAESAVAGQEAVSVESLPVPAETAEETPDLPEEDAEAFESDWFSANDAGALDPVAVDELREAAERDQKAVMTVVRSWRVDDGAEATGAPEGTARAPQNVAAMQGPEFDDDATGTANKADTVLPEWAY